MVRHEGNEWVFSSGRKRYGHTERLSIDFRNDGSPEISYGSDGGFWSGFEWDKDPVLSKADLRELAELQIQRWQEFIEWLPHQEEA